MKQEFIEIKNWKLSWAENNQVKGKPILIYSKEDIDRHGLKIIDATVPGNFELDFMREGLLDDVYFSTNCLKTYRLENLHLFYFADFEIEKRDGVDKLLVFEGIDTVAEIFVDGRRLDFVENMHHAHSYYVDYLSCGKHEVLIHIHPVCIYARKFDIPSMCFGMKYNHDAIEVRKSGSMFGWDIMPRIVSAGIWKPVKLIYQKRERIKDPFIYLDWYNENEDTAVITTTFKVETNADFLYDYKVLIKGKCSDSVFCQECNLFTASNKVYIHLKNPKLWWPKNYGEPNLYDIEMLLLKNGEEVDRVEFRTGFKKVWLKRTSRFGEDGDFCFYVNYKRVFVMGTNWVPTDAFPSRHKDYDLRGLEFVNDLGCNMIRCWGGNTYPSEQVYDYCDEHGIMIWQDFSMGCAHYPDDERLCDLVKKEVKEIVIEKRNHPSLTVWAGDNECDVFVVQNCERHIGSEDPLANLNPNYNKLTRDIILRELRNHDATRPYLPSSPFIDEETYRKGVPSENHLWGPRDYFKGDFYSKAECHFASEIGYHGCPSPQSLKKFIAEENLPYKSITDIYDNSDWLIHATSMETVVENNPYAYRLPLMVSQVERIFSKASDNLDDFARQSQISQAEAMKFFIEMFRAQKPKKTGILWWNVIDGWPQVSDAVIDWYGVKKLAYGYIKRSQNPLCMFFDEPKMGNLRLMVANDSQIDEDVEYKVVDFANDKVVLEGKFSVLANENKVVDTILEEKNKFYLIEWKTSTGTHKNHYATTIGDGWAYEDYIKYIKKVGFYDEFEGF